MEKDPIAEPSRLSAQVTDRPRLSGKAIKDYPLSVREKAKEILKAPWDKRAAAEKKPK